MSCQSEVKPDICIRAVVCPFFIRSEAMPEMSPQLQEMFQRL